MPGGSESPGRSWMLIFTAQSRLDKGSYFPVTAVQRFDATLKQLPNHLTNPWFATATPNRPSPRDFSLPDGASLPVVFPDSCKVVAPHSLSFNPPPPPQPKKDAVDSKSPPLLFKSLVDCARIVDSEPNLAAKAIDHIRELASDLNDPTERVAFYFSEALNSRLTGCSAPDFREEEIELCYRAFNDACPYSMFVRLTANQAILEATESAERIHIIRSLCFFQIAGVEAVFELINF